MVGFHLYISVALSVFATVKVPAMQVPAMKMFENTACVGKTSTLAFFPDKKCDDYYLDQCFPDGSHSFSISCATNYGGFADSTFGNSPYLLIELHADGTSCGSLESAIVYPLDGQCHGISDSAYGVQVTLNRDSSVSMVWATDSTCAQLDSSTINTFTNAQINTDACVQGSMKLYSNAISGSTTTTTTTATGASSGASACFVAPIAAILTMAQTVFAL